MAAQAKNDKTSSVFVSSDKFEEAARSLDLPEATIAALWSKLAEGSSQRIIGGASAPREDAANVNSWHWSELDQAPWAKTRLTELLVGLDTTDAKLKGEKGWVKVTELTSCEGEASVSNRKGKRIVAFELNVKCKWKGQVDYDDVEGELLIPYISEDVADADYEVKLTAKDPKDDSHKRALRLLQKELPRCKAALKTFWEEIYKK
jgi:activator of HSP90 ATPase